MTLKDIYELMDKFEKSDIAALELEFEETKLKLDKASSSVPVQITAPAAPAPVAPVAAPAPAAESGSFIKAPLVGTFYTSPAPGEAPFVTVGKTVKKGETVCLIEAMKMINEVPSPYDCIIEQVLLQDGETVAFDTPIFAVKPL